MVGSQFTRHDIYWDLSGCTAAEIYGVLLYTTQLPVDKHTSAFKVVPPSYELVYNHYQLVLSLSIHMCIYIHTYAYIYIFTYTYVCMICISKYYTYDMIWCDMIWCDMIWYVCKTHSWSWSDISQDQRFRPGTPPPPGGVPSSAPAQSSTRRATVHHLVDAAIIRWLLDIPNKKP